MNATANEKCFGKQECRLEGCYETFFKADENVYTTQELKDSLNCARPALWLTIRLV